MKMDRLLKSPAALPRPLLARFGNGTSFAVQHVGPLVGFLFAEASAMKRSHPELWQEAEEALVAAAKDRSNTTAAERAWLAAYNLLSAAKLLAEEN